MQRALILINRLPEKPTGDERDVLEQARVVELELARSGYSVERVFLGLNLDECRNRIVAAAPDIVFNLVEEVDGKAHLIFLAPALLDSLGVPYTGCRTESVFLTSQKVLAKKILKAHSIPTPRWFTPVETGKLDPGTMYIAKPLWEDASVGITDQSVFKGSDMPMIESYRKEWKDGFLVEEFIDGREFNLSLLAGEAGPEVLPPAEIVFRDFPEEKPRIVGYAAKWDENAFEYRNTVRRLDFDPADDSLLEELKLIAVKCWRCFGLNGYARVDFRVDGRGRPFVLEVNANPCISPDAGFHAAVLKAGYGFHDAIERIIADASR